MENQAKKKFRPIVLGSDENAYGTARLFSETCDVLPLLLCAKRLTSTRYSRLLQIEQIDDFEKEEVFADKLLAVLRREHENFEKLLVLPCSDYYTALLVRNYDKFEGLIANRFVTNEMLDTFDTKDHFYALCDKYDLEYPKTAVCTPDKRESIINELPFDFPIVVKPENSNATSYLSCHFEGQKKVFFFSNKEDYLAMIANMNKCDYDGNLIIQEFIPGGDDAMRVMNAYCSLDGKVRAMCLGQPVLEYYDPKSIGNYAAIISRSDRELYKKIGSFLEEIGYVGFANFDIKFDSRTGRYLLFEINPRLGRSSFFCRAAGVNMMRYLIDDVVFGKTDECFYNEKTALWRNVPMGVVRKYVKNEEIKKEIKKIKSTTTLFYKKDMNLRRLLVLLRPYLAQYKNFHRYFFDKSKNSF